MKAYSSKKGRGTEVYYAERIAKVKSLIRQYFVANIPTRSPNTNPENFEQLADAVDPKRQIITERFICDVYNLKDGVDVKKNKTKFTSLENFLQKNETIENSGQVESQGHQNIFDLGSNLVDQLIDEYSKLMDTRNQVDQILSNLKKDGKSIEISNLSKWITADEFFKVRSIIEYYRKVSVYHRNNRLNVAYLCNNDCLYITYWYVNYFSWMFKADTSEVWDNLRNDIYLLRGLVDKIDSLKQEIAFPNIVSYETSIVNSSEKELKIQIQNLNKFLDFSSDKPDSYYKMHYHSPQVSDLLSRMSKKGFSENVDSYYLRQKLAGFYYMISERDAGLKLWHYNQDILHDIFHPDSLQFKEETRLYLHSATTWKTLNQNEVAYCKGEWGTNSVQSLKALICKACLSIKFKRFDDARVVLMLCEDIISKSGSGSNQIQRKSFHLDFNFGKLYFFEARNYSDNKLKMRDLLEIAIGYFNRASINYGSKKTHENYINYYLFESFKLLGYEKEMTHYADAISSFFKFHPISSMCHVDKEELSCVLRNNE